jgi:tripartite-type tricarboxylate transporter receptor subunit TctC
MLFSRVATGALSFGLLALSAGAAWGQPYPNKPVRIVTSDVGGSPDFLTRLVAQGITGPLGQNVIVENRASIKATELVAQAPADGYTLLFASIGLHVTGPYLQKVSYHPIRDFSPVAMAVQQPNLIVVTPALPVKSVKELIAYAKTRPGELNYGSSSTGSSNHLAGELFNTMAGVKLVRINYKGMGQAMIDLIGGQTHLAFPAVATAMPHLKSGKLRALAVASARPYSLLPGLPTVSEAALPGYESASIYGLLAPARTPAPLIRRLNHEVVTFVQKPEARERLLVAGSEPAGSTPDEMMATMKSESAKWGKVIKDAGIKPQG